MEEKGAKGWGVRKGRGNEDEHDTKKRKCRKITGGRWEAEETGREGRR